MKKYISSSLGMLLVSSLGLFLSSCSEEAVPAATVEIFRVVNQLEVTFTAASLNADSYVWDFGDGQTGSDQIVSHIYSASGTYAVTCIATGPGGTGEASSEVTVVESELSMLTGGPAAADGKSWLLSKSASDGDGVYLANAEMDLEIPLSSNILSGLGIPSEYKDGFTFHNDDRYTHDTENDSSMTSLAYATLEGLPYRMGYLFITLAPFTPADDATFIYREASGLTLDVTTDAAPEASETVTWDGYSTIEVVGDEFIGLQDYTRKYIVFEVTPEKLVLGMFVSTTSGSNSTMPTRILRMTLVPA
ncbi:MAG: PKD domain-containing protein [Bacteroidota bacterium]